MLEVSDITVAYGDVEVLHGMSVTVEEGEIVALVGANAAGKTTTINTISGMMRPGEARFSSGGSASTTSHLTRWWPWASCRCPRGDASSPT